jgi:peptide/nickel transport system substrate-binding protein
VDPAERLEALHEMQRIFYEDAAYAVLWYGPVLQAYRTDRFEGYTPQPTPQGDLLTGYSRDAALTIRPAGSGGEGTGSGDGEGTQGSTETRGVSAGVWIAVAAAAALLIVVFLLMRRRTGGEDRE